MQTRSMKTRRITQEQPTKEDLEAAETLLLLSKGQPPIPTLILSENLYEDRCSLVGCYISVQRPLLYCSKSHKNLAEKMAAQDVPVECIGAFESSSERDRSCGCLLINKANQVITGVPQLHLPDFFSTIPNHLHFVKSKNNPVAASSTGWIFFNSSPPPQHGFIWGKEKDKREFQVGSSSICARDFCLLDPTTQSWSLSLYQHAEESLYCLSHASGMIPQATRIDTKIKLKRKDGKWIINKETVSDTLPLLNNQNRSETSAAMNPPASLNENTDVVEAEDQTLMGNRDPNTQKRSSVHQ